MLTTLLIVVAAVVAAIAALYYFFPGVLLRFSIWLARRHAGLRLAAVTVDGHRIPYLEGGSGAPLVLLHGFGANKDNWTMVAPFLTPHFHVYIPDLPGFGDASRIDDATYDVDNQLARIAGFAETLGLDTFHLGGNSMGGYLALLFAHRHPQHAATLWLLAPAGAMTAEQSEVFAAFEDGRNPLIAEDLAAFDQLMDLVFTQAPPMPPRFRLPLLARSRAEAAFNHKIFADIFAEPIALEDTVDGLATPTLLVWGDNDRVLHKSGMEIIAGLLQNVETLMMERMGHVPMVERPAESARDYLRFRGVDKPA